MRNLATFITSRSNASRTQASAKPLKLLTLQHYPGGLQVCFVLVKTTNTFGQKVFVKMKKMECRNCGISINAET